MVAAAIGLFQYYWFGSREKVLLIPITVLSAVALFFFLDGLLPLQLASFWPLVLLAAGFILLYFSRRKEHAGKKTL
ncbi:hypothetical protein GJU40_09055 [Bacillus lacus]|uniref:DUF5668 domain-containing protein n=1 Tax=Metabacillus lacus TaxID=1983721 RepID=A0A7X2IZ42_9BACI|nr:hypothetical protein [Metabacillus lacus]MRX72299.1 hypothetical protein [Metabacillus lacus]